MAPMTRRAPGSPRPSSGNARERPGRERQTKSSTAFACGVLASAGAIASLSLALTTDVITSGVWLIPSGIAAVLVVLIAPPNRVLGWAAALSIAAAFTASASTAPADIQSVGRFLALGLLTVSFLRAARDRRARSSNQRSNGAGLLLLLIAAWALQGVLVSMFSEAANPLSVGLRWGGSLMATLVASLFSSRDLRTLLRVLGGFAMAESVLVYLDFFVKEIPVWGYRVLVTGYRTENSVLGADFFRSQGAAGHAILLAFIVAVGLVCVWIGAAEIRRSVALLASVAFIGVVLLSGTRSAILALIGAFGYLLIIAAPTFGRRAANAFGIVTASILLFSNPTVQRYLGDFGEAFTDSGSYSHRAGALESVPKLLTELPVSQVLLGGGSGASPSLFAAGYLQQDGLEVVDNQFVTTFIESGLIGVAFLVAIVLTAVLHSSKATRALIILAMTMFASFDFFLWLGPTYFLFTVLGLSVMRVGAGAGTEVLDGETAERSYARTTRRGSLA